jgi:Ser-tRNA(Ala) deacylase AlaX
MEFHFEKMRISRIIQGPVFAIRAELFVHVSNTGSFQKMQIRNIPSTHPEGNNPSKGIFRPLGFLLSTLI